MRVEDCLFCKMIDKKIPADSVFDSDTVFGFKDIHPQAPTHCLFIPKEHLSGVREVTKGKDWVGDLVLAANEVARKNQLDKSGYRLVINQGENGGQTVGHLHLHLLGGRKMTWPPG
jgi:histidine triad (HIT) family protein